MELNSKNIEFIDIMGHDISNITVMGHKKIQAALQNCGSFTKCITKINGMAIDDAKDLELVMRMYNSSNYSDTTSFLWFYSKDKPTKFNNYIGKNYNFKSFMYKTKLLGNTTADRNGILKHTATAAP